MWCNCTNLYIDYSAFLGFCLDPIQWHWASINLKHVHNNETCFKNPIICYNIIKLSIDSRCIYLSAPRSQITMILTFSYNHTFIRHITSAISHQLNIKSSLSQTRLITFSSAALTVATGQSHLPRRTISLPAAISGLPVGALSDVTHHLMYCYDYSSAYTFPQVNIISRRNIKSPPIYNITHPQLLHMYYMPHWWSGIKYCHVWTLQLSIINIILVEHLMIFASGCQINLVI